MTELPFPENHHLSLPDVRLSKSTFLVFEKDQIFYTNLQSGQSISTPIIHRSEICKLEALYAYSYIYTLLIIRIIPRAGMEKTYGVSSQKFGYPHTRERTQISDFFLALDFHPSPVPAGKTLSDAPTIIGENIYRYFPVGNRIFDLYKDPEFKQKLESIKIPYFSWFLGLLGGIVLVTSIALGLMDPGSGLFWLFGLPSLPFLGYGIYKLRQYRKKEKDFSQKYNLPCYFK
ncbi:MAG: hypothetical protein ACTSVZ_04615 [Promethearchaeota archaeon]